MTKQKLDLDLALPKDAAACDACVQRMVEALQATGTVSWVHVDREHANRPKLCLHYDPTAVRLEEVKALVESTGARLTSSFEHVSIPVVGLRHERQARLLERLLTRKDGVLHTSVSVGGRRLYVEFDPTKTTREALLELAKKGGVEAHAEAASPGASAEKHDEHEHAHGGLFGERTELVFAIACGALTGIGWMAEKLGAPPFGSLALYVCAFALGAWFTLKDAFVALRARKFEIDFLMLLAAAGAALLGEWMEGALLLFLFSLGHGLEGYAMGRARKAITALAQLVPKTAIRLDENGGEAEVGVETLVVGDQVLVKPNSRIPVDGFVSSGTSSVNQAPITGESVPVDKQPVTDLKDALAAPDRLRAESRVFAGSINGTSALHIVVTKNAGDSTLARVVKMVSEAEAQKSPTQQFTDRFERVFVPIILVAVVALLFAWVVVDEPFSRSFYRAMAVLVAASPCALAIATPSAVLAGVARAARSGVLIKGGAHLESLGLVRAIAFDKTGTLTEGRPRLTDIVAARGTSEDELLAVSWSVEKRSDHPLARAIVEGVAAKRPDLPPYEVSNLETVIGFGVRATVAGNSVAIGKPGMFTKDEKLPYDISSAVSLLQSKGRTVMVVRSGERFLGVMGVMDTPRAGAEDVLKQLHEMGVERTLMLTGDNQLVADAVAKHVGIREARGDLLPEQKVSAITELARSKDKVAMVGDGVNDAPAMANATVGIAMGAGGSDVALETADVALMADDLHALPFAVGLSRAARRIIRQNLWASLGMVAFLIPATIFGFAKIGVAVALHEGSTLVVVANALRLLAFKDRRGA